MRRALLRGAVALAISVALMIGSVTAAAGGEAEGVHRSAPAGVTDGSALGQQLQGELDQIRSAHGIPGVSLSVLLPGARTPLTVTSGTTSRDGDPSGSTAVTASSLFEIGGITRTMTAALVQLLAADGKLSLDDPLAKYFPEYPAWAGVTVRELLNMTSGVVDYTGAGRAPSGASAPGRRWTLHQLADLAYDATPNTSFAPGQGWEYSATNAILAGMIAEKVTGHSFAGELRRRVLGPQGANLTGTYYGSSLPAWVHLRLVDGYDGSQLVRSGADVADDNPTWSGPAGAAVSDTPDVALWTRTLFSGGLLPAGALRELNQFVAAPSDVTDPGAGEPTDTTDPDGYTLGWDHGYDAAVGPFWFKLGDAPGYQSWTGWFPCSNLAVSIGTNQAPTDSTDSTDSSTSGIAALHEMAVDAVLHSPDFSNALAAHPAPYLRTCPR